MRRWLKPRTKATKCRGSKEVLLLGFAHIKALAHCCSGPAMQNCAASMRCNHSGTICGAVALQGVLYKQAC